jgi:hypothetical protein
MDDRELNIRLWRAFWLGARTAVVAYDIPSPDANRDRYMDLLNEIASGSATLNNPGDTAALFKDADAARSWFASESQQISDDRELAERVRQGMSADLGSEDKE